MNRFLSALKKVGHVSKVVGQDTLVGAEIVAPIALPLVPGAGPMAARVVSGLMSIHKAVPEGGNVNPLESFAITMVLGILQTSIKNPAHKVALQGLLVGLATDIFVEYGMVPFVPPASPVVSEATAAAH